MKRSKMAKHVVTPELEDAFKQFAARLPEPGFAGSAPQTGQQLEPLGISTAAGLPLQAHQLYYVINKSTRRQHLTKMRRAYRRGGRPALVQYLVPYVEFLKTA